MVMTSRRVGANPSWNHDGRRAERLNVFMKASVRETGSTKFDVQVQDLSVSGLRFETAYMIAPSTRIWLTIPGLSSLEAIIAWQDRFRYGCYFTTPLHIAVFEHIVAQHRRSANAADKHRPC